MSYGLFHVKAVCPESGKIVREMWVDDWYGALGSAASFHMHPPTIETNIYVDEHLIWVKGAMRPTSIGSIDLPPPESPNRH